MFYRLRALRDRYPRVSVRTLCAKMSETVPPPEITEEGETG
jgi:hypothetical protein